MLLHGHHALSSPTDAVPVLAKPGRVADLAPSNHEERPPSNSEFAEPDSTSTRGLGGRGGGGSTSGAESGRDEG